MSDYSLAIRAAIRRIPRGKVATYSQIATLAGYPNYHRQVVQVLQKHGDSLPWHRVVGAGGRIRIPRAAAIEQRFRLEMEGVQFRGSCVDMARYQYSVTSRRFRC